MTSNARVWPGLFIALSLAASCVSPSGFRFTSVPDCVLLSDGGQFCIDPDGKEYIRPLAEGAGDSCVSPTDRAVLANERDEVAELYLRCKRSPRRCR